MDNISNIINSINEFLHPKNNTIDDFELYSKNENIIVVGSFDFSYYHNIEILFEKAETKSKTTEWTRHPEIEILKVKKLANGKHAFTFTTDGFEIGQNKGTIEIIASSIKFYATPEGFTKGEGIKQLEKNVL